LVRALQRNPASVMIRLVLTSALIAALLTAAPTAAEERIALYDRAGEPQGYAVIDELGGRFEVINTQARRVAWGAIGPGLDATLSALRLSDRRRPSGRPTEPSGSRSGR
jgi:hypothetical protein